MTTDYLKNCFHSYQETHLKNRYIHLEHTHPLIKKLEANFEVIEIGFSVLGEPIHSIKIGSGPKKILMWSQMHGNESTTTKAVFDICNVFAQDSSQVIQKILNTCTIMVVPILNPDGAKFYTRHNANDVDLNRDAKNQSQPESRVLRNLFDSFKPDFCFNLHGQRTIFGAGNTDNSATLSFLSPAQDKACTVSETRKKAMEVIVAINKLLQTQIPNQIGIYDDVFNENCVGDTFQSLNCPTILFEAGHFKNDYNRESTRFYMFQAILFSVYYISSNNVLGATFEPYFDIPENRKNHFDVIVRDVKLFKNNMWDKVDLAIQYHEVLKDNEIVFIPKIEGIGDFNQYFGHREILVHDNEILINNQKDIKKGLEVESIIVNSVKYSIKLT
ncbi:M14 family zinc carboxypeptidase [Xanthomarina sp. F2636L]|uniref:M14 family zinc carboxypeptidase n=1 Tax=Xanthomarina sp. F2636L TaxID=2996018 RepID=UPI00225E6C91|nr:M14 family zinc carboxypeptidase [Xanthomarina sp. F2636L]MCX7549489.1 M14 family zinc carboxypeptidase [Xanthomarina sp. F2636L]